MTVCILEFQNLSTEIFKLLHFEFFVWNIFRKERKNKIKKNRIIRFEVPKLSIIILILNYQVLIFGHFRHS